MNQTFLSSKKAVAFDQNINQMNLPTFSFPQNQNSEQNSFPHNSTLYKIEDSQNLQGSSQDQNLVRHNLTILLSQTPNNQEQIDSVYKGDYSNNQSNNNINQNNSQRINNISPFQTDINQQPDSLRQESFNLLKIEKDYLKYSQDILVNQQITAQDLKPAINIQELTNRTNINIIQDEASAIQNSRMAYKCLQVSDFSSLSQSHSNIKNSRFFQKKKINREQQNNCNNSIFKMQLQNNELQNQNNSQLANSFKISPSNLRQSMNMVAKHHNNSEYQSSVPIRTKMIYEKAPSRSTNSSPHLKKRGKRNQLGLKQMSNQDQKYKLPSMAQFLQKSILPKKQTIINDIYIQKLNKFQNLLSIVGDGNYRLANNMVARSTEDYDIQKSLLKEMQKQRQQEIERKLFSNDGQVCKLYSDFPLANPSSSQGQRNGSVNLGSALANRISTGAAQGQRIYQQQNHVGQQIDNKNENAKCSSFNKGSAVISPQNNKEIINNYKGLLKNNLKSSVQNVQKSLKVSPNNSFSKMKMNSAGSIKQLNQSFGPEIGKQFQKLEDMQNPKTPC